MNLIWPCSFLIGLKSMLAMAARSWSSNLTGARIGTLVTICLLSCLSILIVLMDSWNVRIISVSRVRCSF